MGLLSSSNKSSNTTNNNTDNSSINLNAGGVGVDGDDNFIQVTDGGAFDLVGGAFEGMAETLEGGFDSLVDGQVEGLKEITALSQTNSEINAETFQAMIDQQGAFTGEALDYSAIQSQRAIEAVQNSNDAIAETVQRVSAGEAGQITEVVKKLVLGLTVVGGLFAASRLVK